MGPTGYQPEPRANTVITNVTTVATGAIGLGLIAAAALPVGVAGAVGVVTATAVGGLMGNFVGKKLKLGEPDVLVRHPDGALYITVKFSPKDGHELEQALEEVRRYVRVEPKVLYLGIRRTDLPGHPYVLQWQRTALGEAFSDGEWMPGARVEPLKERSQGKPPSINQSAAEAATSAT